MELHEGSRRAPGPPVDLLLARRIGDAEQQADHQVAPADTIEKLGGRRPKTFAEFVAEENI